MTPPSNTAPALPDQSLGIAPAAPSESRPMLWSVRRELWENRSLYLAPLIVTAVVLFASLMGTFSIPRKIRTVPAQESATQYAAVARSFGMAPAVIMLSTFLVGFFYALDALYGERRDRSILFWKSLPVSDATTVLSKASIPLVVVPLIAFVLSVTTQFILLLASTAILLGSGMSAGPLWAELRFFQGLMIMIYGLTVHALWFAPIYGWLLLVSAWARRAPFLWAVLPALAIAGVEKIAFDTSRFLAMLQYRVTGGMAEGFSFGAHGDIDRLSQLEPGRFLTAPGLWVGLVVAAAALAAATRLRRNREPI